jgi:hypothetical protein
MTKGKASFSFFEERYKEGFSNIPRPLDFVDLCHDSTILMQASTLFSLFHRFNLEGAPPLPVSPLLKRGEKRKIASRFSAVFWYRGTTRCSCLSSLCDTLAQNQRANP